MAKQSVHLKKNDQVQLMAGKEKGKRGKVLRVYPQRGRVLVEHLNMIKRHTRPSEENQQGGIVEKEGSVHISNAMVVCGKCDVPVRIRHQRLGDDKKVRVCGKCGEPLDKV
ncbi:MAG: 50S ribosomal protein L24 [bacterium]|nr:50S ribosomal protein L24 [bacterium]